jgi:hypothetical protein
MDDRDQRIREIAYHLWEQEGCPESQADRHWAAAVAIVEEQDAEDAGGAALNKSTVSAPLERSPAPPRPPLAEASEGRRLPASR